ncbi:MAG: S8 family serine peptidase [Bacteroidota bacterium]
MQESTKDKIVFKIPPVIIDKTPLRTRSFGEVEGWHHRFVNVQAALDLLGEDGSNVTIGVVDTGVDFKHLDLKQNLQPFYFDATTENNPQDENDHGTHCVGNIGATVNNRIGVKGVLPNVKGISAKGLGRDGSGDMIDVASAIKFCRESGCDIISLSLGAPFNSWYVEKEIKACEEAGVLVVAAAGNQGKNDFGIDYPAAYDTVLAVAAVDELGEVAWFSTRGNVDVAAPGVKIYSTITKNKVAPMSGTSMATPIVAALAGMMVSFCKRKGIAYTLPMVRKIIKDQTHDAGVVGIDDAYGVGIIDFLQVAKYLLTLVAEEDRPREELDGEQAPIVDFPNPPNLEEDTAPVPTPVEEDIPFPESPFLDLPLPSPPPVVEPAPEQPVEEEIIDSGSLNKWVGYVVAILIFVALVWQFLN